LPSAGTARASVNPGTSLLTRVPCGDGGLLLAAVAGKGMSHPRWSRAGWALTLPAVGTALSKAAPSPWPTTGTHENPLTVKEKQQL